jgi:hypothetical protein
VGVPGNFLYNRVTLLAHTIFKHSAAVASSAADAATTASTAASIEA